MHGLVRRSSLGLLVLGYFVLDEAMAQVTLWEIQWTRCEDDKLRAAKYSRGNDVLEIGLGRWGRTDNLVGGTVRAYLREGLVYSMELLLALTGMRGLIAGGMVGTSVRGDGCLIHCGIRR